MSRRLRSYVRSHRKRSNLTQKEIAFLLGLGDPSSVYRHEWAKRQPLLDVAVAYELVFGEKINELFGGVYDEVELAVLNRACSLQKRLEATEQTAHTKRKLDTLRRIIERCDPTETS